jgi:stress responsive alpha/beta barrel protein
VISHIVLFNPKSGVPADQRRAFALSLRETCRAISSVRSASVGRAKEINAGYARSFGEKTYKYAAVLEFDSESGLIDYLQHPLHRELGRLFWETCESTVVIEVETVDGRSDRVVDFLVE